MSASIWMRWKQTINWLHDCLKCWVCLVPVVDFGAICSRVRDGHMALPLFKKPVDLSRRCAKRFNSKRPTLYITVDGCKEASQ